MDFAISNLQRFDIESKWISFSIEYGLRENSDYYSHDRPLTNL
jgi:hypothetical protein